MAQVHDEAHAAPRPAQRLTESIPHLARVPWFSCAAFTHASCFVKESGVLRFTFLDETRDTDTVRNPARENPRQDEQRHARHPGRAEDPESALLGDRSPRAGGRAPQAEALRIIAPPPNIVR